MYSISVIFVSNYNAANIQQISAVSKFKKVKSDFTHKKASFLISKQKGNSSDNEH